MTRHEKIPSQAGFEPGIFRSRGGHLTTRPVRRYVLRRRGCNTLQQLSTGQQIVYDNPESKERLQHFAAVIYWTTDCI